MCIVEQIFFSYRPIKKESITLFHIYKEGDVTSLLFDGDANC